MKKLAFIFLVLFSCGSPDDFPAGIPAQADSMRVKIWVIDNPAAVSDSDALEIWQYASDWMRNDLQIRNELTAIERVNLPGDFSDWNQEEKNLMVVADFAATQSADKYLLNYFIAPPLLIDGRKFLGGISWICKFGRGINVSLGNATRENSAGENRIQASGLVIAHELGHSLCAHHDDELNTPEGYPFTIMNSNAGYYFTAQQREQPEFIPHYSWHSIEPIRRNFRQVRRAKFLKRKPPERLAITTRDLWEE